MEPYNQLTIVCPTVGYNGIVKSLESYRKYAPGAKIIVIDQSKQGCLTEVEFLKLTDVYIKVYRALGFSKAMNMGIEISTTPYVCCANDDVELVHVDWFPNIIKHFNKNPKIVAVNLSSIKGYRGEPDSLPYKENYTQEDWEYLISKRDDSIPKNNPGMVIDGIMTWFTVFEREKFEMVKSNGCYFDEKFYPGGGEDYDLMCRIYSIKLRAIGIFDSWAYHHWFQSQKSGNDNYPEILEDLRWNYLEGGEGSKWGKNWDLWGPKDKHSENPLPVPLCTKINL